MKHIIWSNMNLKPDDWKESYKETAEINGWDEDTDDEDNLYRFMVETNDMYLDDERMNLNVHTEGRIIAIADVGLWNGRRAGYQLLEHNVNNCLSIGRDCEYAEFYCDRYDLKSKQCHHDGTNFIVYRELKPEVTSDQADNFCWKLYNGKATQKDITRYTRSLKNYVKQVYGWR